MKFSGLCLLCFIVTSLQAQNLVPNYSFEIDTLCPLGPGEIYVAVPWTSPSMASSDYYNECATASSGCSIPNNAIGHQWARTGKGYAGIYCYFGTSSPNEREYIQIKLTDSLITGKKYCVSYYVSLADSSSVGINGLSAYLSSSAISCSFCPFLAYTPQINYSGSPITDTVNWVNISGEIIAAGGEKYITISNFNTDANTSTQFVGNSGNGAYFYIDDVSVIPVVPVDAGNSGTICPHDSLQLGTAPTMEVSYSWIPPQGLSNPNSSNPKASPSTTTTYTLTQTQCNVVSTSTVTVNVDECDVFVPNAFSPNHDGENDLLFVYSHKPLASLDFSIYDRWGEKVFETTNQQTGWDGTFKNKPLDNGVFVYVLHAVELDGTVVDKKGNVSLIR